jgi:pilus assembly protein CpaF
MSFEVILPFLRPIEHLICDSEISEIMVNGSGRIFIEKDGELVPVPGATIPEKSLQVAVRNIARTLGDEINDDMPLLDARLPDGSRVAAAIPPCSRRGTTLTIRKFQARRFTPAELVRIGTMPPQVMDDLEKAVEQRQNILISGGTSSGKTTMLNALASFIDPRDRVVLIEDTSEIQIALENLVEFEARREQPQQRAVTIRDLLRATLRHRPDRIILGEVRGGEAFDLLQALNTGHSGTLSTIHANSAEQAVSRFISCILQSGVELPYKAIRSNIGDAVHLLLHIERRNGKRCVSQLLRLMRYDSAQDRYDFDTMYELTGEGQNAQQDRDRLYP